MVQLTYKLLAEFLLIFKYNGVINVYWDGTCIQTISEDTNIEGLKSLPEDCSEKDFYVALPGHDEMEYDKALEIINLSESLKMF